MGQKEKDEKLEVKDLEVDAEKMADADAEELDKVKGGAYTKPRPTPLPPWTQSKTDARCF